MAVGTFAQSIPSGTGRVSALGGSPFILDAHVDMLRNPAWNNYYRNYAFSDLNSSIGTDNNFNGHAGVTFNVTKQLNLGMVINKRQDSWLSLSDSVSAPIVPFMGLIGYSASKNFHISLAPYVAMWNSKHTGDTNYAYDRSSSSLGANLGFIYMLKKGWVEGMFKFRMNKYKDETTLGGTTTTQENDGGMEFGAGFRGWIYPAKNSKIVLVPLVGFSMYSLTPKVTSGSTTTTGAEWSWMVIDGGVGLNWPITDDIQIAGGVLSYYGTVKSSFTDTTGTYENKSTGFGAPIFNMAVETRITDWITGRLGFTQGVNMRKNEMMVPNQTHEMSWLEPSQSSSINLGAGFHFGRFSIDATVSHRWLKQGPYFISGSNSGNNEDLFGIISASYNFG
ncbi:MAG: hypothetical protein QW404_03955, partial [Candidatus Nanoarchaeia archaeon]